MSNNNIHTDPARRHDFVLVFEVERGNPNGDPDAGNLPRVDPETGHGIVTDVCLKRKVRDYLQMEKGLEMFIQSETALNTIISKAARNEGAEFPEIEITLDEDKDNDVIQWFSEHEPFELNDTNTILSYYGDSFKQKDIAAYFDEVEDDALKNRLKPYAKQLADSVKKKKLNKDDRDNTKQRLIKERYDIRMFGAVLSTGLNAGQVRGPVQLTFAKSVDPIFRLDNSITRIAITKEADKKRKETEMARKPIVPYALYVAHGFYNPYFALKPKQKKDDPDEYIVTEGDLENLWEALEWMFNTDTAAARGRMATRGLYVFSHDNKRGNAPSHKLFRRIKVKSCEEARSFEDYLPIEIYEIGLNDIGIKLTRIVHEVKEEEKQGA
ncbi:MAG: type I CRISPR-associated protein Cas7 [Nitrospirota bacterium]